MVFFRQNSDQKRLTSGEQAVVFVSRIIVLIGRPSFPKTAKLLDLSGTANSEYSRCSNCFSSLRISEVYSSAKDSTESAKFVEENSIEEIFYFHRCRKS